MRHFMLTSLIVCMLPTFAVAEAFDFMRAMRSIPNREYHKDHNREKYLALWHGNGAVVGATPLWRDEEFRRELDLTPEQREVIDFMFSRGGSMGHWYRTKAETDPVLAQMMSENRPLNEEMRRDPYGENTPPEIVRLYLEQVRAMTAYYFAETQRDVENTLTPEQMQKVREAEMALMSEIPILNPSMFHALGLTDEQKAQMDAIRESLDPLFEQIVEELVEAEDAMQQMRWEMFEKVGLRFDEHGQTVAEEGRSFMEAREAMERELSRNVEFQARMRQINERASGFMRDFQFKMLDILTDEQLLRMQHIIDNPSAHVRNLRERMQTARAERSANDAWQPDINSWRPGDPLPESYRQRRNMERRFPQPQH